MRTYDFANITGGYVCKFQWFGLKHDPVSTFKLWLL